MSSVGMGMGMRHTLKTKAMMWLRQQLSPAVPVVESSGSSLHTSYEGRRKRDPRLSSSATPPRVHRLQPVHSDPPASFLFVSGGRPHPPGPRRPLHVPRGGPRGGIESKIKFNTAECEEGMVQRREKTQRGREGGGSTKRERERAQGASGVGWEA
ncbi:unnamed protein product [Musa banksii]